MAKKKIDVITVENVKPSDSTKESEGIFLESSQDVKEPTQTAQPAQPEEIEEIIIEEPLPEITPEPVVEPIQESLPITPPQFVQKKRGRKPGSTNQPKPIKVETIPELDLRLFCDMADSIAISLIGPDAAMSVLEKTLFYSGIEHYSKTVGAETVQKISQNATPFFLLAGLVVWGLRIFTLYTAKKKKDKEVSISNIPETVNPQNVGVSPDFLFANTNRGY